MHCKDCDSKMHIRTIRGSGGNRDVTYCSEYAKGKGKHLKCHSSHRIDVHYNFIEEVEFSPEFSRYSKKTTA